MIITLKRKSFQNEEKDIEIKTTIDMNNYIDKDALNNLTKFNYHLFSLLFLFLMDLQLLKTQYLLVCQKFHFHRLFQ